VVGWGRKIKCGAGLIYGILKILRKYYGPRSRVFFPFIPESNYNTARDLREAQLVGGVVVARKVLWAPVPNFLKKYYGPRYGVID
jgi:hypothetical protein